MYVTDFVSHCQMINHVMNEKLCK